jgi:hypothetical protein
MFAGARRIGRRRSRSPAVEAGLVSHVERERHVGQRLLQHRWRLWEVLADQAERRPSRTGPRVVDRARFLACRIRCTRRAHRREASVLGMCCIRIPLVMVLASVRSPGLPSRPSFAPYGMRPATDRNHCASGCRLGLAAHMHLLRDQHSCSRWQRPGDPAVRKDSCRFARKEWWRQVCLLVTSRSTGVGSGRCRAS